MTVKDMQEINRLYDSGLNCAEVAQATGWSNGTVGKYIWNPRGKGNPMRNGGRKTILTSEHHQIINEMHKNGMLLKEIAQKIGCHPETIRRYIKKQEMRYQNAKFLIKSATNCRKNCNFANK